MGRNLPPREAGVSQEAEVLKVKGSAPRIQPKPHSACCYTALPRTLKSASLTDTKSSVLEKIHNQLVAELGQKHCQLDWGSELFLKPHVPIVIGALLEI